MSEFEDARLAGIESDPTITVGLEHELVQIRPGGSVHSLERLAPMPWRRRGTLTLETRDAFLTYLGLYRDPDTLVFAHRDGLTLTAIVDYHRAGGEGGARFGEHRAILKLKHSVEWIAWTAMHHKKSGQLEFAEFLEEHALEIVEPDGATVLEIATNLEAKREAQFASAVVLQNGAHRFTYDETIRGSSRKGELDIPDKFTLALRPFEGGAPFRVEARFRYRVTDRGVVMWVALARLEDVLATAFEELLEEIQKALADLRMVAGVAPAADSIVPTSAALQGK
jgi:uncharacterized protein YfdQ (DUF2303 family)